MKARELIELIEENCEDNDEVVFLPQNSYYPERIDDIEEMFIVPFYGNKNRKAMFLTSGGQVGGSTSEDEDDEDEC